MSKPAPILIAEDEPADVVFLLHASKVLQIANPLVPLEDGEDVVRYLEANPPPHGAEEYSRPALLLLDLKMRRMTGFDVLEWLQTHPDKKTFPVVVLTSSDQESDRRKALSLGASDYRVKPSGIHNLADLLREIYQRWLKT
jgi:two-component system response regulator